MQQSLTVRQLNIYVKSLLESDVRLLSCCVKGEISNFKRHVSSGHLYFTLGDESASVKCVMFRGNAARCKLDLKNGALVNCYGRISLYEKDGTYQLYVESVNLDGDGDKLLALNKLKEKLLNEGLFDAQSKRALPKFPKRIAIVTSGTGAALQDIINIISRRYPVCELVICSAGVQGENAPKEMIAVLDRIYNIADMFDTIIIGRGGGSNEDLYAFNDEELARKVYSSPIPVVSAVGHQTDTTICDLVADMRAPTPSAAAEICVPESQELLKKISNMIKRISLLISQKQEIASTKYYALVSKNVFSNPLKIIEDKALFTDTVTEKILNKIKNEVEKKELKFANVLSSIDAMSPLKVMLRGYNVAIRDTEVIKSVSKLQINDKISLNFSDGKAICRVEEKI
ncbi:MAG: exodeoxyribonuclease VII large subunit [Acutalibacteraceae bacterium]|nr:exodeoxyribonuclease VII large subunit [Acutalibacteraceae bacterium]